MKVDLKNVAFLSGVALLAVISVVLLAAQSGVSNPFSPYVDKEGQISLPKNYRTEWIFLGTWSIANEEVQRSAAASGHDAAGLHNVYTQPSTLKAYRKTGRFPDGAVLVKELLKTKTDRLTTGHASWGYEAEGWFVMIKDTVGRFPDNPLWGEGWGWALFNAVDPPEITSRNFRSDCLGCHIPAQAEDYVFVDGYPTLTSHRVGG